MRSFGRASLPVAFGLVGSLTLLLSCAPVTAPTPQPVVSPLGPGDNIKERVAKTIEVVPTGVQKRIEAALEHVQAREMDNSLSFWTVLHGILGNGPDTTLVIKETGERVKAIDYICDGGKLKGLEFTRQKNGLDVTSNATPQFTGFQGHQDQFIAEMAQWAMPLDRKVLVDGEPFTFNDFIRHAEARASVTEQQELSWTLIVIAQYRGTDYAWTNDKGEKLKFEDIIRYEVNQPVENNKAACGGTHRLFGLTWAYHLHLQNGGKTEGVWKDVARTIEHNKKRAKQYQNPDQSFSTRYLSGSENVDDMDRKINTTGHVLEWLALAMTDEELRQPWVEEAANHLALLILASRNDLLDGGSLYHAAHGLHLYHARIYGSAGGKPRDLLIPLPPAK